MTRFVSKVRLWILIASTPVQKLMQKLHKPEPKIKGEFFRLVQAHIRTLDVLLSREDLHFTNFAIPGFWSHAAIYNGYKVVEAVGDPIGVQEVDLAEWILRKDYVLVLRPTFISHQQVFPILRWLSKQIGEGYDYTFGNGPKVWYCSGIVRAALTLFNKIIFTKRKTFGVDTVTPQDFENAVASGKFIVVADSRK